MLFRPRHRNFMYTVYLLSLCSVFLLSSCKTPYIAPTKTFIHTTDTPVSQIDNLSVIVDSCVVMDGWKDYVHVEQSCTNETYMASSITSYFENIGYNIVAHETPFVGDYLSPGQTYWIKRQKGSKVEESAPPFHIDEKLLTLLFMRGAYFMGQEKKLSVGLSRNS